MAFVLDASVSVAWCFEDETSTYTEGVLELLVGETAVVPVIWPFEIANALQVGERRLRSTVRQTSESLQQLLDLPVSLDDATFSTAWGPVLSIGRQNGLAVYDAAYLELAQRRGLPVATIDVRQRDVAFALGIPVVTVE